MINNAYSKLADMANTRESKQFAEKKTSVHNDTKLSKIKDQGYLKGWEMRLKQTIDRSIHYFYHCAIKLLMPTYRNMGPKERFETVCKEISEYLESEDCPDPAKIVDPDTVYIIDEII